MRKFDLFPKLADANLDVRTNTGGLITIATFLFMIGVLVSSFQTRGASKIEQLAVINANNLGRNKYQTVYMNITVAYPCQLLRISVQDVTGNHQLHADRKIKRQRLTQHLDPISEFVDDSAADSFWSKCGSCLDYASTGKNCCMTCFDIAAYYKLQNKLVPNLDNAEQCKRDKKAIQDGEVCRIVAEIGTGFSRGKIRIDAGGETKMPVHYKHDLTYFGDNVNLTHWIDELRFGPAFQGQVNPLSNAKWLQRGYGFYYYHYLVHLVPTNGVGLDGKRVDGNQYSASFSEKAITKTVSKRHPGIAIGFDTSPISVKIGTKQNSTRSWLLQMLSVMGGGFILGGLLDSFVFKVKDRKNL